MNTPDMQTLTLTLTEGVLEVGLNRPDKANSMDRTLWTEIGEVFRWADGEPAVRAIVLFGQGKHFSAGIDLGMLSDVFAGDIDDPARRAEESRRQIKWLQDQLRELERCRKPVLAALHGAVIGGAIDLISYADMRYASACARFCIKEVDVGLVADVGTLQRLPRLVGEGIVRELAYTGRTVEADEALRIGLVNAVADDPQAVREHALDIARQIAEKSPLVIRGIKEMLNYTVDHTVEDGLNYVATWNAGMMSRKDLEACMVAAMEKRRPLFDE